MLSKDILSEYNNVRKSQNKGIFCHAAFVSMNFDQYGNASVCCYNRTHILGTYPTNTIKDMWYGQKAEQLRHYMKRNFLPEGCNICYTQFQSKNFGGLRASAYDTLADYKYLEKNGRLIDMPKVLEFEISNVCNLECIMCFGQFSSSIRKNREHLPPIKNPYDTIFVEQLEEFIPHLTEAKFLGGEPFLIKTYYQIWDLIIQHNPHVSISITTNGTVLNKRVIDILEKLNAHIIMSIDSLEKENYERIRINAKFDRVMENFRYFREYVKRKNTGMSISVCPMQQNWREIPRLLAFCNMQNVLLYFNTIEDPHESTLRKMSYEDLHNVVEYLRATKLVEHNDIQGHNNLRYHDMISQIDYYKELTSKGI